MSEVLEFNVSVNLAGVGPVDVMQQDPPNGPHEVEILGVRQVTNDAEGGSGKTTLRFALALVGGPAAGLMTGAVIGTDWSKDFNRGHLKNALLGLHTADGKYLSKEALNGTMQIAPALFTGKRAFIICKAPMAGEVDDESGRAKRADKNFITREMYEAAKRAAASAPPVAAVATATPGSNGAPKAATATPPPTAAPAATGDLNALFQS